MAIIDGGTSYGCSEALERQAYGISRAGRQLADVLKGGGTLPATYTIAGTVYNVTLITGVTADGTTNNQTALSSAVGAARGGTPTLLVLPPANDYYRYNNLLNLSENTYVVGYGAKVKSLINNTIAWTCADNSGVFGFESHTLDSAMSRWLERHETNTTLDGAKDGTVSTADETGWTDAHVQMLNKTNCIMFDVHTRGSFAGGLRCTSNNVLVENCSTYRTHSDSFHMVKQTQNATVRNCRASHSGDDMVSMIQYDNSLGGARPSNILVENCHAHGSRARCFSAVSANHVLFLRCTAERGNLAPYLVATTSAHSTADCNGVKIVECEAWRGARVQAVGDDSSGFLSVFTSGAHSYAVTGLEVRNNKARWFGTDFYKTGIRQNANAGSITISVNTGNDFAAINSAE